jgi:aspartyl-tRNA(Asn)/glutamyl-tRNA(Gln) amidotransferase subunit A
VVAARLAAAATGSDTGGSVRIPAAFCGVVGFKPTFGRLSTSGLLGACPTFDHVGMIARTPGDAGLLYQVMSGRSPGRSDGGRRRLGVGVARSFFFDRLTAGVARAMDDAVGRFERLGALVEDRDLPVDAGTMARVFDPIVSAEIWARYGDDWRERPDLFSSDFAGFFRVAPPSPGEVVEARRALAVFRRDMGRAMDGIDVVLTPTVPVTAPPIAGPIDAPLILRNTWPFNAARTPAISIPCGTDPDGLPIGLQLAGREGTDEAVLEAARRFTTGT